MRSWNLTHNGATETSRGTHAATSCSGRSAAPRPWASEGCWQRAARSGPGTTSLQHHDDAPAASNKPKRGGTLRLASSGGGTSDTLDGNNCTETLDFARAPQLYDCLMEVDANAIPQLALADELTPNADATEWTIRVRKGVEFHNGKTLTIDDVLYTFNRIVKNNFSGASGLAYMDLKNVKKLDAYTVSIPMTAGYSILPYTLVGDGEMSIVPEGYDPKKPGRDGRLQVRVVQPRVTEHLLAERQLLAQRPALLRLARDQRLRRRDGAGERCALERRRLRRPALRWPASPPSRRAARSSRSGPDLDGCPSRCDSTSPRSTTSASARRCGSSSTGLRCSELVFGGHGLIGNDMFGVEPGRLRHAPSPSGSRTSPRRSPC